MEKLHRMQMRAVSINGSAVYIYVHVHGTCISLTVLCVDAAICRTCGGEIIGAGKSATSVMAKYLYSCVKSELIHLLQ